MLASSLFQLTAALHSYAAASSFPEAIANARALLSKRQDDDDYSCHADCGYTIIEATGSYCTNQTWINQLNRCLDCADDDDLWRNYGDGVSGAARGCDLNVSPDASISVASATTGSVTATSTGSLVIVSGTAAPTSVGNCHSHGDDRFCVAGNEEWEVTSDIDESNAPDGYGNCRAEDDDTLQCSDATGRRVTLEREDDDDASHVSSVTASAMTGATSAAATQNGPAAGTSVGQVAGSATQASTTGSATASATPESSANVMAEVPGWSLLAVLAYLAL